MLRTLAVVVGCALMSLSARADGLRVGLYPLTLPPGHEELASRLTAQLHEGASALPGLRAFDVLPKSACGPSEGECLAGTAQRARIDRVVSAEVSAQDGGYRVHLRSFDADGTAGPQVDEEVHGGPLDLGGALENGVCRVLGGAPCLAELRLRADPSVAEEHLFLDGEDEGPVPLASSVKVAVGRHALRLGKDEQKIRFSFARTVKLAATRREGEPVLVEDAFSFAESPRDEPPAVQGDPRQRTALALVGLGAGLLVASGGTALYARAAGEAPGGAGTPANVRTARALSIVFAASGVGALVTGGLVWSLAPNGVAVAGSF